MSEDYKNFIERVQNMLFNEKKIPLLLISRLEIILKSIGRLEGTHSLITKNESEEIDYFNRLGELIDSHYQLKTNPLSYMCSVECKLYVLKIVFQLKQYRKFKNGLSDFLKKEKISI